jgi:cytolysin (calcineurin-like family phosphatase)
VIPDGWQLFVLSAQPTGTCSVSTYLTMSLVNTGATPSTDALARRELVTLVMSPADASTAQPGQPIDVDGNPATLTESADVTGAPTAGIDMTIGAVHVNAHGTVDATTLRSLVATLGLVDDATWAQLVSEVATP